MLRLISVQIELTTRCNEHCLHCYLPSGHTNEGQHRDLDGTLLLNILDQCREMGIERLIFSGGEPMLHPLFDEAVSKVNKNGVHVHLWIFSNLTRLRHSMINKLKAMPIVEVQTSLYSVDPTVHDAVTQAPGSCKATKDNIERLHEEGVPVFISCPLIKQNKDSYPGILEYAKRLNIRCAPNISIAAQSGGSTENLVHRLSIDEALAVIQDILEHDTAYNAERFLPGYDNTEDALPCVRSFCRDDVCVNAKGEVLPSPVWNYPLGNLAAQSLRDIWENSPDLKKLQDITLEKKFPQCLSCPDIHFCGLSLGSNANENPEGSPFIVPEQTCILARHMRELLHGWHKNNMYKEI